MLGARLQSLCFTCFIWVFAFSEPTWKRTFSIFILFAYKSRAWEMGRRRKNFHHPISASNGLHAHTSREDFMSSALIDVEIPAWDFRRTSVRHDIELFFLHGGIKHLNTNGIENVIKSQQKYDLWLKWKEMQKLKINLNLTSSSFSKALNQTLSWNVL